MKKRIEEIKMISGLKNHYASNSRAAVKSSIENDELKEPVVINTQNELVHGYTRTAVFIELGYEEIEVIVEDVPASLYEYTVRNTQREKTVEDQIKDIQVAIDRFS